MCELLDLRSLNGLTVVHLFGLTTCFPACWLACMPEVLDSLRACLLVVDACLLACSLYFACWLATCCCCAGMPMLRSECSHEISCYLNIASVDSATTCMRAFRTVIDNMLVAALLAAAAHHSFAE